MWRRMIVVAGGALVVAGGCAGSRDAEKQTTAEQTTAEQTAAEKTAAEQTTAEQTTAEQTAAEKTRAEKTRAENVAAKQATAEREAAEVVYQQRSEGRYRESRFSRNHDMFLSADDPPTVPAAEASFLLDDDEVVGFVIAGQPRAYSVRMLSYHHVVNDRIGETPIAVTY